MAASAALAITLTPVLMGYLIRGRLSAETRNPSLATERLPAPLSRSEFMPCCSRVDLLYMPTTLRGVSINEAANILQLTHPERASA